ncbi:MAG: HNH endonuclease signature motif containing protein [Anaerostipes sp.]|nr:HNH endonuclease signature motif containing protein [Anaerostipes sp.]
MNYFFVFQNKSYDEEYRGGYLWAPQSGRGGKRVSHWEKMKSVKRGDIIIHSFQKKIMAVSIAQKDVYAANKPTELSEEWQHEGWRVDTQYIPFLEQIITSDIMDKLLELQPKTDAPFNRIGRGNTGYLFEANKEMYQYIIQQTALAQNNVLDKQRVIELLNFGENSKKTELEVEMDIEEIAAKQMSPEKLAKQVADSKPKGSQKTESVVYYRSPYIKEMVKQIADGKCQMCGEDAPFYEASNKPYLEEHHVKRLADGGKDAMDNVVAICPNCHRKIHVLNDEVDTIVLEGIAKQNEKQYERLLAYAKSL